MGCAVEPRAQRAADLSDARSWPRLGNIAGDDGSSGLVDVAIGETERRNRLASGSNVALENSDFVQCDGRDGCGTAIDSLARRQRQTATGDPDAPVRRGWSGIPADGLAGGSGRAVDADQTKISCEPA